jgi:hypothetical protein
MGKPKKPSAAERIRKLATANGIDGERLQEIMDDLVHDFKSQEASSINNGGIDEQVEYIGFEDAERAIQEEVENARNPRLSGYLLRQG